LPIHENEKIEIKKYATENDVVLLRQNDIELMRMSIQFFNYCC
jgi:hypothetical protein